MSLSWQHVQCTYCSYDVTVTKVSSEPISIVTSVLPREHFSSSKSTSTTSSSLFFSIEYLIARFSMTVHSQAQERYPSMCSIGSVSGLMQLPRDLRKLRRFCYFPQTDYSSKWRPIFYTDHYGCVGLYNFIEHRVRWKWYMLIL